MLQMCLLFLNYSIFKNSVSVLQLFNVASPFAPTILEILVFPTLAFMSAINIMFLMDAIPLCDVIETYTGVYVNTQQLLFN